MITVGENFVVCYVLKIIQHIIIIAACDILSDQRKVNVKNLCTTQTTTETAAVPCARVCCKHLRVLSRSGSANTSTVPPF